MIPRNPVDPALDYPLDLRYSRASFEAYLRRQAAVRCAALLLWSISMAAIGFMLGQIISDLTVH